MKMSDRNAERFAQRQGIRRSPITAADVEDYTRVHYPELLAEAYVPGRRGRPMPVPDDEYVAALGHERFHEWFGTECDDTCPHRRFMPPRRTPWWRRLIGWVRL